MHENPRNLAEFSRRSFKSSSSTSSRGTPKECEDVYQLGAFIGHATRVVVLCRIHHHQKGVRTIRNRFCSSSKRTLYPERSGPLFTRLLLGDLAKRSLGSEILPNCHQLDGWLVVVVVRKMHVLDFITHPTLINSYPTTA